MLARKGSWALDDQMVRPEGSGSQVSQILTSPRQHQGSLAVLREEGCSEPDSPFFPPRPRSTAYHGPADSGPLPYCQC